jgi:hypothetical protein
MSFGVRAEPRRFACDFPSPLPPLPPGEGNCCSWPGTTNMSLRRSSQIRSYSQPYVKEQEAYKPYGSGISKMPMGIIPKNEKGASANPWNGVKLDSSFLTRRRKPCGRLYSGCAGNRFQLLVEKSQDGARIRGNQNFRISCERHFFCNLSRRFPYYLLVTRL